MNRLIPIILLFAFSRPCFAQPNAAINEKLSVITYMVVNDEMQQIPEDSILGKFIKIELISQEEFFMQQEAKARHFVYDTTKIRKKKGVLRLPLATGFKTFTDKLTDDDGRQEYEY